MKPERSIGAGEFKAKCLELLDRVARDGDALVVTKRGRPVARVVPVEARGPRRLRGSVRYLSDIVEPLSEEWLRPRINFAGRSTGTRVTG